VREDVPGIYNGAGDGVLVLSEVLDLLGKRMAPVLPPFGTGLLAGQLGRVGLRIPVEMLNQLRYGRGIDNRRLKAAGFTPRYTTREAVIKQAEHIRLRPLLRGAREPYRYEQEVEEFLRWSPNVRRSGATAGKAWRPSPRQVQDLQRALSAIGERPAERAAPAEPTPDDVPVAAYDTLAAVEVIAVLPSLTQTDLEALRRHESTGAQRIDVIEAIDRLLAPSRSAGG
jgi:UDP-glucose 4-epimerase